jgi:RsmE family RNA methyltransferase
VNLILLEGGEIDAGGRARLDDHRARHAREVLRVAPGDRLRIGIVDGPLGQGEVEAVDARAVVLRCALDAAAPPPGDDLLLLAVPRPKVLGRCLEHAAALGFARIVLVRTWRTDKSHLRAQAMQPDAQRCRLLAGLAQARRTALPRVLTFARFKPFVEDRLDELVPVGNRFVADPNAATALADARVAPAPFSLAIGPERGFLPYEVDALAARGFVPVHAGPHPLVVETALASLHGQLAVLRTLAAARAAASMAR